MGAPLFYVKCTVTGLKSTPALSISRAERVAEEEGFVKLKNGKWVHKHTEAAKNDRRS